MSEISIIVPVYNVEKFLPRCIDCILAQSFENFKLILVDDGSTDHSGDICDQYAKQDNRIHVIHKENGGVSAARNTGLEYISGKYVAFCDSDDYWESEWLQQLYTAMQDKNADCVIGNYIKADEYGNTLESIVHNCNEIVLRTEQRTIDFLITEQLTGKIGWEIWTRLFKTEIIQLHHIRFCERCENFAEDLCFVLEYSIYCHCICSIEVSGYCYIQRDNSMMHRSVESIKLNAMNEVSLQFGKRFFDVIADKACQKKFPILHFLIMNNQYTKLTSIDSHNHLPAEIKKIKNKAWYHRNTLRILGCKNDLKEFFGDYNAKRIILLSKFCIYKIWKLFVFERMLFYRNNKR